MKKRHPLQLLIKLFRWSHLNTRPGVPIHCTLTSLYGGSDTFLHFCELAKTLGCFVVVGNSVLMMGQFLKSSTDKGETVRFHFLVFGHAAVKSAQNEQHFKIVLKPTPNVIKAQNKLTLHYFGGMLALRSGLYFLVSASKVPFFGS